jgi:GH43 family beta-xylosidase
MVLNPLRLRRWLAIFALATTFSSHAGTFTNPIVNSGADPWVVRHGAEYFFIQSHGRRGIYVSRAASPVEIGKNPPIRVWNPPPGRAYSKELWAPELHYLRGNWYIYFAADDGDNANHRIYVLQGTSQDPRQPFVFFGELKLPENRWAIDGTVLTVSNELYFVWSGWVGTENIDQRIYIARMQDPLTVIGNRVCISRPEFDWEKRGNPLINEGPEALWHNGKLFIIYSASGSWGDDYCLGQLTFKGGDPLRADSWVKKSTPVFARTSDVFGLGHCCFVESPDGAEDWIIYHAAKYSGAGWNRNVRAQKFSWNADGSPNFGTPVSVGEPLSLPSGTTESSLKTEPLLEPAGAE